LLLEPVDPALHRRGRQRHALADLHEARAGVVAEDRKDLPVEVVQVLILA
jgi:hypothetical protein